MIAVPGKTDSDSRSTDKELGVGLLIVVAGQVLGDHLLGYETLLACVVKSYQGVHKRTALTFMHSRSPAHPSRA